MSVASTGERVVFKKGLFVDLPSSAESNVLLFVEDQGRLFKGNGIGKPLTEFTNVITGFRDLDDLEKKNPALRNKIYVTYDNHLYIYDGSDYVSVGGGTSGTVDHSKLLNRGLPDQHPISSITGLQNEINAIYTKIDGIRFRGFYQSYADLPTSISTNRNGDIAVVMVDGKYTLYAYNSTTYTWEMTRAGSVNAINKHEDNRSPLPTDDISLGFEEGQIWINTSDKSGYICIDNSLGKAVWKLITLEDLTPFTTADLKEAGDKYFVSSADKSNLLQLASIIATQQNIQQQLNNLNAIRPADASASNKLVSNRTVDTKIKNTKFEDLANTPSVLTANAFLVVDSTGTRLVFKEDMDIERYINKVRDKDGNEFPKVQELHFANLQGDIQTDGSLKLTAKMFSTDILDMPSSFENNKLLVSNGDTRTYELKSIDELAILSENFDIEVTNDDADWIDNTETTGKYEYIIRHGLDSLNILAMFYDTSGMKIDLPYKILNRMEIVAMVDEPVSFRAVVNCSQGTSSEKLQDATKPKIVASDFIDDLHVREDKTYSSEKIESIVGQFAKKNDVYTKLQSDSIYASKEFEHSHRDLTALNNLEEDEDGDLTYKGKKLMTQIRAFYYEDHWSNMSNSSLEQIIDMRSIYNDMGYTTIVNSELTIKNLKPSVNEETDKENALHLVVMDNDIKVLDVEIMPQDVQKYLLGISPNLKVFVKGYFDANLYIGAF